jgi:hypothetical protein
MDKGFNIPWAGDSIYHGYWVKHTMVRGINIPWVRGQNTMDMGVKITWVEVSIYHL